MNLGAILGLLACLTALAYMVLGLAAFNHRLREKNANINWVMSPIWALFPSAYDDLGKRLCNKGRYLFWSSNALAVLWLVFRN